MWKTVIAIAIIIVIVGLAVFSIVRDKKKGKCSCGNSCSSCAMKGACHTNKK
jgi:hypothetical protein